MLYSLRIKSRDNFSLIVVLKRGVFIGLILEVQFYLDDVLKCVGYLYVCVCVCDVSILVHVCGSQKPMFGVFCGSIFHVLGYVLCH